MLNSSVTSPIFKVAQESKSCMMFAKSSSILEWKNLPMNHKISVLLRLAFVAVCMLMLFGDKPPMGGQTHSYITASDAARDVTLGQLSDFKNNQQTFNLQTQTALKELADRQAESQAEIQSIEGWEKGGFGVLTGLSILAMFFQLKKKG